MQGLSILLVLLLLSFATKKTNVIVSFRASIALVFMVVLAATGTTNPCWIAATPEVIGKEIIA